MTTEQGAYVLFDLGSPEAAPFSSACSIALYPKWENILRSARFFPIWENKPRVESIELKGYFSCPAPPAPVGGVSFSLCACILLCISDYKDILIHQLVIDF